MMTKTNILIADDDKEHLEHVKNFLLEQSYQVFCTCDGDQALLLLQQNKIDLLITNFQLNLVNGNKLYKLAQAQYQSLPILITTNSTALAEALVASQKGIFGFISKPIEAKYLAEITRRALTSIKRRNSSDWKSGILTCTKVMEKILDQAHHVAESNINVVIQGPKGCGKKLLAKAIHAVAANDKKPFIYIDCTSLDEDQLNQQLLNNLNKDTKATIFLDNINKLGSALQQALLTGLQSCQRAIAAAPHSDSDLRIICSCKSNLEQIMLQGYFDRELFYLINIITLNIPALRERVEDIPLLSRHFLAEHSLKHNRKVRNISPGALHLLAKASWPGNVRELGEVVKQVVIDSNSPVISEKLVAGIISDDNSAMLSFNQARANFERDYLIKVLQVTEGNVTHAARIAERNRTDFYKLLNKHELSPADFKKKVRRSRTSKVEQKLLG
ncbi:MAG: two-component system response regulator GlrR [Oceanospirillaceae bacterium]|jgi:two-component system response regulator GlrR